MRVLFNQCAPAPLIPLLFPHQVTLAFTADLDRFGDGVVLSFAEREGFDFFLTTDQSMYYQQNWSERSIAVIILQAQRWTIVRRYVRRIALAVNASKPGRVTWISMPKY